MTTDPAGLAVLTPPRFPQPALSGYRWSGEGAAGGRSRRDAKRPSGDRGSRHADWVGSGLPTPRVCRWTSGDAGPQDNPSPPHRHRRPAASPRPVPKTLSQDRPLPLLSNAKAQVNCNIHQKARMTNHAGGVRDVLRHLSTERGLTRADARSGPSRASVAPQPVPSRGRSLTRVARRTADVRSALPCLVPRVMAG